MRYTDFEDAFSSDRMSKYVTACNGDTRKAMTLYRYNLQLSQELFTLVSCFEVTLRNRIDRQLKGSHGNDWLRDAILPGGALYYDRRVEKTRKIVEKAYNELMREGTYSHSKLLSEMEFGVWKYMFSNVVYALMGQTLLRIFPRKPTSSRQHQYDNSYMFQELGTHGKKPHSQPIFGIAIHESQVTLQGLKPLVNLRLRCLPPKHATKVTKTDEMTKPNGNCSTELG